MKTVIGFDSWIGGAHNFARLVPAFRERGFDLQLLHIGSWGGDVGRPNEEMIGELAVRDVSFYKNRTLLEILDILKPSAVVFLSNDVFAHRAFNRYCTLRSIPTLHLYHGLVEVQSTQGKKMYKTSFADRFFYVTSRIPKALSKIWPLYAHALRITKANSKDWGRFFSDIINLTIGKYISFAASDSRATACAIYTNSDFTHAVKKYGYAKNEVHVVGNPDLIRFNLTAEMLGCAAIDQRQPNEEIVYVDTGLIYAGMVFSNAEDYLLHLTTLAKTLALQGLSLAVKLHPDHHRTNFPARLVVNGIRVVNNEDFVSSLLKCRAAMVEPSTASLIPALLGLPILMVAFGKLEEQKYGKVLTDYPTGRLLTDAKLTLEYIERIESGTSGNLIEWINVNSGPLPAADMPQRVANIIAKLVCR
jgi:hypothetical protein